MISGGSLQLCEKCGRGGQRAAMDHIILVLMVAVVGSLLLPATRLARVVKRGQSRTTYAHYRVSSIQLKSKTNKSHRVQREAAAGRETIGEIKEQTDHNPSAGVGDFEFRPLTEEEKKAFVNSLDAKGRQMLAELAGKATSTSDPEALVEFNAG